MVLFSRFRLLNENYYFKAFEKADAYDESLSLIDLTLDDYLKANLKVGEENEFNPSLASRIFRTILKEEQSEVLFEITVKENVGNGLFWLKKEGDLILYFPREELIEKYSGEKGNSLLVEEFMAILGYEDLPDCKEKEVTDLIEIISGKLTCIPEDFKPYLKDELLSKANTPTNNIMEAFLNSALPKWDEEINVFHDFDKQPGEVPRKIQEIVYRSTIVGFGGLIMAIIFTGFSSLFSIKPALSALRIILNSGIALIVFSLIGKILLRIMADFFLWGKLTPPAEVFSEEQTTAIMDLLKSIYGALLDELLLGIVIMGIILIGIFIVFLILFKVTRLIRPSERSFEEDESEETNEDGLEVGEKADYDNFENGLLSKTPEIEDEEAVRNEYVK